MLILQDKRYSRAVLSFNSFQLFAQAKSEFLTMDKISRSEFLEFTVIAIIIIIIKLLLSFIYICLFLYSCSLHYVF
jgi:hypothetical protein